MTKHVFALVAGSGNVTGYGVISAIHQAKWPVPLKNLVVGYDCCEPEANPSNQFCENFQVPRASDIANYAQWVMTLVREFRPKVIIPSNDHDLRSLLMFENDLHENGVIINGAGPNAHHFLDKLATARLFVDHEIRTPAVICDNPARHPYVVRKRYVGTGKKFTYVSKKVEDDKSIPWEGIHESIITKFIEGEEYTIDILCDQRSNVLSIVPRLRHAVTAGIVTFAEIVNDKRIIERSRELATRLQLRGMNCVQCIKNDEDIYFFEVNPRPGSGMSLTTAAGVNMPSLWIRSLSQPVVVPEPEWGMKMVRYHAGRYFK